MKTKRSNFFTSALNSATHAINSAAGMFQELSLPEGEKQHRFRLSAYGEFPGTDIDGKPIMQVIDRAAGEAMAANFNSLRGKLATFGRGIAVYEGHADDEGWMQKNPGHRASAVARIKSIEPSDDGIYVTSAWNSDGLELMAGDAPRYSGHSPYWRLVEIKGRPGCFRPVLLWSTALTNNPNIPNNTLALNSLAGVDDMPLDEPSPNAGDAGEPENPNNNTDHMKLTAEALKALGLAPDAVPTAEEISAAIVKLASDQATAAADKVTAEGATTAANSRLTVVQSELDALNNVRDSAVNVILTDAINSGRITEADRPLWTDALNTSFVSEREKLNKLVPVLNVQNQVPPGERRSLNVTDAANAAGRITEAVREFAGEKNIDITTEAGWTRAFNECKAAKPDLFVKA